jgi:hypothetical protein
VLPAKDGEPRHTSRDRTSRPRYVRAVAASVAIAAGIGTVVAGCGLLRFPRRKRRIPVAPTEAGIPLQQLTRYRSPDGTHSIHGTLLVEFKPGDRSTAIHVAFCPPFERLPMVEVEVEDDACASAKLTQLLHHGVEIEVRRSEAFDEQQSVTVQLFATDAEPDAVR